MRAAYSVLVSVRWSPDRLSGCVTRAGNWAWLVDVRPVGEMELVRVAEQQRVAAYLAW